VRGQLRERRMRRHIEQCGLDFVKNAVLPDGMDGVTHIDYLLLTPTGIVVADLKRYQGILFGAEHIDQWTQVLGQKSFKFANPLFKNELDVMAVKAQVPSTNVTGRVIFSEEGDFPKGIPTGVSRLGDLKSDLGGGVPPRPGDEVPAALAAAWATLRAALLEAKGAHAECGSGSNGIVLASMLLALACAWAAWVLHTTLHS
jgi:hypothetical protein